MSLTSPQKGLTLLILILLSFSTFAEEKGNLVYFKGTVHLRKKGQKNYKEVEKGMTINSGDVVKTGSDGLAIVKSPELTIKVMKSTKLKVYFKKNDKTSAWITKGGAVFNLMKSKLKKPHERLQVRTRSASIGVRGTVFMAYSGQEKNSILSVQSGKVSFQGYSSERALLVGANSSTLTNQNKENLRPRNFGLVKRINWNFDTKKNLKQSDEFYSYAENLWKAYKKEQEVQWKNYKKEQEEVWNNFINN